MVRYLMVFPALTLSLIKVEDTAMADSPTDALFRLSPGNVGPKFHAVSPESNPGERRQ